MISIAQLNSFVLSKQHLILKDEDPLRTVSDVAGLHGQLPKSALKSLQARTKDVTAESFNALVASKKLARVSGMRGTLFYFTKEFLPVIAGAYPNLGAMEEHRFGRFVGLDPVKISKSIEAITGYLATGRATREEIYANAEFPKEVTKTARSYVLRRLARQHVAVRMLENGEEKYSLFKKEFSVKPLEFDDAIAKLVKAYFKAYGPAKPEDFFWWSSLRRSAVDLDSLGLVSVNVAGLGELLCLPEEVGSIENQKPIASLVHLPKLDCYTMGYKDRRRMNAKREHYDWMGNSNAVTMKNGKIVDQR